MFTEHWWNEQTRLDFESLLSLDSAILPKNERKKVMEVPVTKVGDNVLYYPGDHDDDAKNNGAEVVPAVVTQVWGPDEHAAVNLKIFPDGTGSLWRTSVSPYSDVGEGVNPFGSNGFFISQQRYYELKSEME